MIGEIISSILGGVGGLMGASAEEEAADANREIAANNLKWDREKFEKMLAIAEELRAEGKLGQTDVRGNAVKFVPGQGWVSTLGLMDQILQGLYNTEEKTQFGDIGARRDQMYTNLGRGRTEGGYADQLLQQMMRTRQQRPAEAEGINNLISAQALSEATRPAAESATRNALRSGNTAGAADVASRIGVSQGDALRKAMLSNRGQSRDQTYNRYATEVGNLGSLYSSLRTGASALPNAPYNPRNLQGPEGATQAGQAAGANVLQAYQQPTPQMKHTEPVQYGMANTLANLGSSIGNIDFSGLNFGGNYGGFSSGARGSNTDRYGPWGDRNNYG